MEALDQPEILGSSDPWEIEFKNSLLFLTGESKEAAICSVNKYAQGQLLENVVQHHAYFWTEILLIALNFLLNLYIHRMAYYGQEWLISNNFA